MGRMDEEQAVFEQSTLSDWKMRSFTIKDLKIITNNCDNIGT